MVRRDGVDLINFFIRNYTPLLENPYPVVYEGLPGKELLWKLAIGIIWNITFKVSENQPGLNHRETHTQTIPR